MKKKSSNGFVLFLEFGKFFRDLFTFKFNRFHYVIVPIIITSIVLVIVLDQSSHTRILKSFNDLWNSIVFFFNGMAKGVDDSSGVTITDPTTPVTPIIIPINPDVFAIHFQVWWKSLWDAEHFGLFMKELGNYSRTAIQFAMLPGLMIYLLLMTIHSAIYRPRNGTLETDISRSVKTIKSSQKIVLKPTFNFIGDLFRFLWSNPVYKAITILIIAYAANFVAIGISFVAWYFYFTWSFDFSSIYTQLVNLFNDISPLFPAWSIPFWLVLAYWIFWLIRKSFAVRKLNELEGKNEEMVDGLGVAIGIVGPQGSGKDVLSSYFALIYEKIFKKHAEMDMLLIRANFPDFPFRTLEKEIQKKMNEGKIVNKIQAADFIAKKMVKEKYNIYGYKFKISLNFYYDGLKICKLEDELEDYASLFYIYTSKTVVANYQIRTDSYIDDPESDRFPDYDFDWLSRDARRKEPFIRSSIIDFNSLRILKPVEIDGKDLVAKMIIDSGVLVVSEEDKNRGNRNSNLVRKENDVRPDNDGTKITKNLVRHLGTVRNYCYLRYIYNMQRFGALAGDENFIAETNIYIKKQKTEFKWAIPLWFVEPVILRWIIDKKLTSMLKHIKARNDITLSFYLNTRVTRFLTSIYSRLLNTYAYRPMSLSLSAPTMSGEQEDAGEARFFILRKVIFANRYRTDMMAGLFKGAKLKQTIGINQLKQYQGDIATIRELISQGGYFTTEIAEAIAGRYL